VVASLALVPSLRPVGWDVTALPRVGSGPTLGAAANRIDPDFRTVQGGGYDGQFYWAIALDPLATGSVHNDIDKPSYRYGHPLYGWLGWLFSAGQGTAAAGALLAVGLASLAAAAAAAAWLGRRRGGAAAVVPALPLCTAGIVEVDVRVDDPRQREEPTGLDLGARAARSRLDERADPAVGDEEVARKGAVRDDRRAADREIGVRGQASSIVKSCAPSQRVSFPTAARCSVPSMTVAKWFPASCPTLLEKSVEP